MVGRKNVRISPWWAAMLPMLRTTGLENLIRDLKVVGSNFISNTCHVRLIANIWFDSK